ncbi:GNAT family N-acetyltransferase [Paenibacillus sp. WLX1005]|uniref:GNAT family N-acetyltransferase n=1 Tax=Paenibacillus sp. WLX1005 TaxID=3243766 RepID=UPI00398452BE
MMTDMKSNHLEQEVFTIDCGEIMLREFVSADLDEFHRLTWQPDIYTYLPGWNVSREQREEWFIHYELPENRQFLEAVANNNDIGDLRLRLAIILKQTGALIGWCCSGIKEELPEPNREIMYAVSKDYRSKGYATTASQGMIRYLFDHTSIHTLSAIALVENNPSNQVITKCGFQFQSIVKIDEEQYRYYKLDRAQWIHNEKEQ